MMLDFNSDGEPEAFWTTDLNGAGEEHMTCKLGTLQLRVAQPGAASVSNGVGTGALVWQAGPALANALMSSEGGCLRDQISGGRVLELGCGCSALPGIALALLGACEALVSDSEAVLAELQPNLVGYYAAEEAAITAGPTSRRALKDTVVVHPLCWDDKTALAALASNPTGCSVSPAARTE